MTVRQTHFVAPVPVILANQLGLFRKAGVEATFTDTYGSAEQLAQLTNGTQDIAVTASDNVFVWNRRGADVRIIAQAERTTSLALFARPGISRLEQLEGRTFGVDALDNGFALAARHVLESAGVTAHYIEAGGVRARLDALTAGSIDAALLGPPFDTMALAQGLIRIASIEDLIPGYPGQGLVTTRAVMTERPEELKAYLQVLLATVQRTGSMTEEEGLSLLRQAGLPEAAIRTMWQERARSLHIDVGGLQVIEAVRRDLGALPDRYDGLTSLIDPGWISSLEQDA